jgi:hypothetical protein
MTNPFRRGWDEPVPASSFMTEADFAEVFAAAEFAHKFELRFETTVTIVWGKLGLTDPRQIQAHFTAFLKSVRSWLEAAAYPPAYLYSHEMGPALGLHTHFLIALPPSSEGGSLRPGRIEFKRWLRRWQERQFGRNCPRAIRPRGPNQPRPWLHWLTVHYLLKGYHPAAVVQSAANSPDGRDVFLGDLIVFNWADPGHVPMGRRYGVSHSLGPDRRALGAPSGMDYVLRSKMPVDPFTARPRGLPYGDRTGPIVPKPFRSRYEDGARDIRLLYPSEFLDRVSPLLR